MDSPTRPIHSLGYAVTFVDKQGDYRTETFSVGSVPEAIDFALQVYPDVRVIKAVPFTYKD